MIDSLVFYRECLTRAYFLGKESDASARVACVFILRSTCGTWVVLWQVVKGNLIGMSACVAGGFSFLFGGGGESFVVPLGSKGWRGGESARLPPMWLGFKSRRRRHIWECGLSLLLVFSFARRSFSPGIPVFPSPQKSTFPNSNLTRNQVDEEPLCGCVTSKSLFIYLFIKRYSCAKAEPRLNLHATEVGVNEEPWEFLAFLRMQGVLTQVGSGAAGTFQSVSSPPVLYLYPNRSSKMWQLLVQKISWSSSFSQALHQ